MVEEVDGGRGAKLGGDDFLETCMINHPEAAKYHPWYHVSASPRNLKSDVTNEANVKRRNRVKLCLFKINNLVGQGYNRFIYSIASLQLVENYRVPA